MRFSTKAVGTLEARNRDLELVEGAFSLSGVHYQRRERTRGGSVIDDYKIQREAINKALEILGHKAWNYGYKSGRRCNEMSRIVEAAKEATGYHKLKYKTFIKWFQHYLKFGETPAEGKRRNRGKGRRGLSFDKEDDACFKKIIADFPQLYLDEIQAIMSRERNKLWHCSTLWRRLKNLGYSLQVAVFRAKQQLQVELDNYQFHLEDAVNDPRQCIFVDESHKSANEARRRRAWSPKGLTPVVDAFFEEDFRKRFTLIAACDINGFVIESCDVVEREHGKNDKDPTRGTVDMARFEQYVEETLVPVLGRYDLDEPRSIVIMDNATIHGSSRVQELIEEAGALLIYTAPYFPQFSPIELMFSVYKAGMKRYGFGHEYGWFDAHYLALHDVTRQNAKLFFKKCGVPKCKYLRTDDPDPIQNNITMGAMALLLLRAQSQV